MNRETYQSQSFTNAVGCPTPAHHSSARRRIACVIGGLLPVSLTLSLLLSLSGCGAALIKGTEVKDTPANRAIHALLEEYRAAMEARDGKRLLKLVSNRYYENASSTDSSDDDYGYERLEKDVVAKLRDNVKKVQYRVLLKRVIVKGDRAFAEYEYMARYLFSEGGREQWKMLNDFNRLDLAKEDGAWKIIAGL